MKKKFIFSLLIILSLFVITGCNSKKEDKEKEETLIKITDNDKGYVTTFKTVNNKFVQTNPKYNHVDSDDLGIFISLDYIESTKEAYDYARTHNFIGVEYAEGTVIDYKWNKYDGYLYDISQTEMSFRILLEDDPDNSIVLSGFVGPKTDSKNKNDDLTKFIENKDFQKFLNSIEFKKEK